MTQKLLLVGASALALLLASCGGGSGSAPAAVAPPPDTGTAPTPAPVAETSITVIGAIEGFGSIIVNGERYATDTADVVIDGEARTLADLSVGQIVALRATRKGDGELPTALRVRYEEALQGEVEAVTDTGFVILGIDIVLTDDTVFEDDLDPETIVAGSFIEVSGSYASETELVASYVELADDADSDYEIHGTVGALDTTAQTFRVRGVKIGYANAELADFEGEETLSNGDKVEVEGSTFLNDGTLVATRVEFEGDDAFEREDGDEAEIEGVITRFAALTDFDVDEQPVTTTEATEYENCEPTELDVGVEVEVEGAFDADGTLVADEVECEREALIRATASVDAVDAEAGTVTVLGIVFATGPGTKFKDQGPNRVREFGLDDIAVDDRIEVRAYETADGSVFAKMVRRNEKKNDRFDELRGFVDSVAEDSLTVEGVVVLLDESTKVEDSIAAGDYVKVRGTENEAGELVADKVQREDDDEDGDD